MSHRTTPRSAEAPNNGSQRNKAQPFSPLTILVADDEAALREVLDIRLRKWGYRVLLASDGEEARELCGEQDPDLVLSDVVMPKLSGIELLSALQQGDPGRPVLLMTAYGSIDVAVEAMKEGARDFLTKPLDYERLRSLLQDLEGEAQERRRAHRLTGLSAAPPSHESSDPGPLLIGRSPTMGNVRRLLHTLASGDAPAILTGESGTGKEVAARVLHQLSSRRRGPFIAVNAAAIPEGLVESEVFGHEKGAFSGATSSRPGCFELAQGGTLLLDEIGEMPIALQPKLLRVLEDRRVRRLGGRREMEIDVRVVAATNRDPLRALREGTLRQDLYYRLNVFTLSLPPLRERGEDVLLLADYFIRRFNRRHGTSVEGLRHRARQRLLEHSWPGNVRELRNAIERAILVAQQGLLDLPHLPPTVQRPTGASRVDIVLPAGVDAAAAERILILETLQQVGENKAEAARQLGLDVKTIRNKLRAWGRA
ncbi:MAG: sigma-54 dependent transcriptional regulator [Acidobacteriota bacterium]